MLSRLFIKVIQFGLSENGSNVAGWAPRREILCEAGMHLK